MGQIQWLPVFVNTAVQEGSHNHFPRLSLSAFILDSRLVEPPRPGGSKCLKDPLTGPGQAKAADSWDRALFEVRCRGWGPGLTPKRNCFLSNTC